MTHPSDDPISLPYEDSSATGNVLTVSSLNRLARSLLEGHFPAVVVEGEISNFVTPASGHWYLTLKDDRAQIRCAMFRNDNRRLRFRPENGMQVLVRGRLSLYEPRGDYQFIADDMEQAGDGALRRAFEKLKSKLADEGLFDPAHKQPISTGYRHIGIVTSATGAAIRDIVTVFRRRFPAIRLTLLPASVQGDEAPAQVVKAIETANRLADRLGFEALIVGRGGGSLEDLQAFNTEVVARAIFASRLPVVSAVGHEIDFTIADFVADLRAPTPSAAAELLSPDQQEYLQALKALTTQLAAATARRLRKARNELQTIAKRLRHPGRRLQDHGQALDLLESRLLRAFRWTNQRRITRLAELQRALLVSSPHQQVERCESRRINLQQRLLKAMRQQTARTRTRLDQSIRNLHAVSPLATLGRGYSITYDDKGDVLRSVDSVRVDTVLKTRLAQGVIESKVFKVLKQKDNEN